MNTQFKINRKAALAACILSTAIWLPLAAQAQDSAAATGQMPGKHMRMEDRSHQHAMHGSPNAGHCSLLSGNLANRPESGYGNSGFGAGFAETDPARWFNPDNTGARWPTSTQESQRPTGFAETDPAALTPMAGPPASRFVGQMQQAPVGFAESDPAAAEYRPGADTQNRNLAVCGHGNGRRTVEATPVRPITLAKGHNLDHG